MRWERREETGERRGEESTEYGQTHSYNALERERERERERESVCVKNEVR